MSKPIHINDFANKCGHFNGKTFVNNGYGCLHPEQQELEEGNGCCFAFSCPLATNMIAQDWIDRGENPALFDDEWVLPHETPDQTMRARLYLFVTALVAWAAVRFVLWPCKGRKLEPERHYSEWNGDDERLTYTIIS